MPSYPTELFDHSFYGAEYKDVSGALTPENRFSGLLEHYRAAGFKERRNPNVLFDTRWYAEHYKLDESVDPLVHFSEREGTRGVAPNRHWEDIERSFKRTPPKLKDVLWDSRRGTRPTYLLGLYGTGRWYINQLIMRSAGAWSYYFQDRLGIQLDGPPVIWSGHTTVQKPVVAGHAGSDYGQSILDLGRNGLANIVFLYRHPLDSAISNWVWWRTLLEQKRYIMGIGERYKTDDELFADLRANFYEFALFCTGSIDFMKLYGAPYPPFFSLTDFVSETAYFLNCDFVHKFRFEDFLADPRAQFSRFMNIVDPSAQLSLEDLAEPKAAKKSKYVLAMEQVSEFKQLMDTLPRQLRADIRKMGYDL